MWVQLEFSELEPKWQQDAYTCTCVVPPAPVLVTTYDYNSVYFKRHIATSTSPAHPAMGKVRVVVQVLAEIAMSYCRKRH